MFRLIRPLFMALGLAGLLWIGSAFAADPPSWYLGYRTTSYAYQLQEAGQPATDEFSSWQHVSGTASRLFNGALTLRANGRFTRGIPANPWGLEKARLYSGHADLNLTRTLKLRAGRQWLTAGAANLTLDGARLSLRARPNLDLSAWGGARAPYDYAYELGRMDDSAAAGARVGFTPRRGLRLALSLAYLEDGGRVAERPLAFEANTALIRNVRAFGRVSWDLEQDLLARLDLQGRWRRSGSGTEAGLQYIDRHPSITANSWFARFGDLERIRLLKAVVRHEWPSLFGGEVEYLGSFTGSRAASRLGLAFLAPIGRLGYSARTGDMGDENSFYGEISVKATSWLRVEAQASLLTYALIADAPAQDERDLTTVSGRVLVDLRPGARLTLEVQSLDNPLYRKDVRFLFGLDLAMARGSSRLGLDRGGWLR